MPIVQHGSLRIDYAEAGTGAPVVLLHSSVSGNRQWRKLMALLGRRFHVIAPNLRGYGATTPWPGGRPHSLADAAQTVSTLIDALALQQPLRLVGHSFGGAVALWLAHTLPRRVAQLALYEPMLPGLLGVHGRHAAAAECAALHADVRQLSAAGAWPALGERFTDYFNGEGAWRTSATERQRAIAELLPPNVHEWDACMTPRRADAFVGIVAPCLLMRGRRTRPALAEISDVLHQRFPQWRMVDLASCGHMAPLTDADVVNRWIDDFLREPAVAAPDGGERDAATADRSA